MLCEKCKTNIATVHFSQTVNGEHREIYLCPMCAAQEGLMGNSIFSLFQMPYKTTQKTHCPTCGNTLDFFERTGRFACPDCYSAFSDSLDSMLMKIHGATRHKGDMSSAPSKIDMLKSKLKDAIETENFEEAAKLRDEIKEMEGGEEK